jgi:hypothetical protein
MDPSVRVGGDQGIPAVISNPVIRLLQKRYPRSRKRMAASLSVAAYQNRIGDSNHREEVAFLK